MRARVRSTTVIPPQETDTEGMVFCLFVGLDR